MQKYNDPAKQREYEVATLAAIMGGCDQKQAESIAAKRVEGTCPVCTQGQRCVCGERR